MATYVIGDVHGCLQVLLTLLDRLHFNFQSDKLIWVGDVVNRGPDSLGVLRFIKNLGPRHTLVLGNHELHLLGVAAGIRRLQSSDTLAPILAAPDKEVLMNWLISCPFAHYEPLFNSLIVHAGVHPHWTLAQTLGYSKDIQLSLQRGITSEFYGNSRKNFYQAHTREEKLRVSISYLTRVRYCEKNLDLSFDLSPKNPSVSPWFTFASPLAKTTIIFGHWSALQGHCPVPYRHAIDTGCGWQGRLTALKLEDFSITTQHKDECPAGQRAEILI